MNKEKQEIITGISERTSEILEDAGVSANAFATSLGYTRTQTIYDILNGKSAPSYDFFRRFLLSEYSATYNIDWYITGRGEMHLPTISTAMEAGETNLLALIKKDRDFVYAPDFETSTTLKLLEVIKDKDSAIQALQDLVAGLKLENGLLRQSSESSGKYYQTIIEQAQEIGQLRERIVQLERRLQKDASDVRTSGTANVG